VAELRRNNTFLPRIDALVGCLPGSTAMIDGRTDAERSDMSDHRDQPGSTSPADPGDRAGPTQTTEGTERQTPWSTEHYGFPIPRAGVGPADPAAEANAVPVHGVPESGPAANRIEAGFATGERQRGRWHRSRLLVASAVAAAVLAVGAGGVAIGHAVADGYSTTGDRLGPAGFDGGAPGVRPVRTPR
jgi:hypothetical protein